MDQHPRGARTHVGADATLARWVGVSAAARRVRDDLAAAAVSARTVAIVGEEGSGRRLAARLIHELDRGTPPAAADGFCALDAGAVLAGVQTTPGKIAEAVGGLLGGNPVRTLYLSGMERVATAETGRDFLATMGELPFRLILSGVPPARGKPGGWWEAPPDGDVSETGSGTAVIRIPPLRDRKLDLSGLALRCLVAACERAGVGPYRLSDRTIAAYHDHDWPGNVEELRAVIESAVSTAALAGFRGRVLPDSFCAVPGGEDGTGRSLQEMVRGVERGILERTLREVGGNQARAARVLRVSTTTLHEKLKRHGLLRPSRAPH